MCTCGGEQKRIKGFWWGELKERDHFEVRGLGSITTFKETGWYGVDWINETLDRNKRQALLTARKNLRVP
jgi:hypothetical protein